MRWIVHLAVVLAGCDYVFHIEHLKAGSPDAETSSGPPTFILKAQTDAINAQQANLQLATPDGAGRLLVVAVAMSADQTYPTPVVGTIMYGGMPLELIDAITGVQGSDGTRSEQWQLVAPPVGQSTIAVVLASGAATLHVDAYLFTGANQTMPVRGHDHVMGSGMSAELSVNSEIGDTVLSTVGQGSMVKNSGPDQTMVLIHNVDSMFPLNNTAGSVGAAASPVTIVHWDFGNADLFQVIATSLRS